ncbi:alpha-mannosidase [Microbacterium sp. S1037]|uniref:alpha-mannosidase n=1 Tax=Microbacterium sp. S1037 TaxID=3398227 RepID=UPI003AAFC4A2
MRLPVADRLDRFVRERLRPLRVEASAPVDIAAWPVPGEPVPFSEARGREFRPLRVGAPWGTPWSTLWLHVTGVVPRDWDASEHHRSELLVDLGFNDQSPGFQAEALAFRPDGSIVKAVSPRNAWVPVEGEVDLYLELAANPTIPPESHWRPTHLGDGPLPESSPLYTLRRLEIGRIDTRVEHLLLDIEVLAGLAEQLPPSSPRAARIGSSLSTMLDAIDPDDVRGSVERARAILAPVLSSPAAASAHTVLATGHAHIDSAWLWPLRETIRKCARTFSNVLDLLERHPDLRFACSSAQQLAWMEEHYPAVFARIEEQVRAGRFVPVGGQWVEPDTNLPGSEATARQLVVGKRWFLEKFGVETSEVWLPDTFGYSASLPQLIRLAGADWFMTQKISWNQTNRMPHHTFWWEGIDGTRVFTHFPPIETYNAELSPAELAHAERTYTDHATGTVSLAPFGWGDGGGGPTREMVERAHRQADLEGSPRVTLGAPRDFYESARDEDPALPVWTGEMYLELHRGTLTSQVKTKQGNRRTERLLHETELWAATAALYGDAPYPHELLRRAWRQTLLLQFHDILPGSSIGWVHREAEEAYAALAIELEEAIGASLAALTGPGTRTLTANSAPLPLGGVGAGAVALSPPPRAATRLTATAEGGWVLSNGVVRAVVDAEGLLVGLSGPSGRNALPEGARAALLRLHPDYPDKWDAWDVDAHDRARARAIDLDRADTIVAFVGDDGAGVVSATRSVGASTLTQTLRLAPDAAGIDVEVRVDWRETHRLLRMVVPLEIHADETRAEIQFGHVTRPTHTNTSWDEARFEVVAQRWIHVADSTYGVAIANDSTYGHSVERSLSVSGAVVTTVGLSILRAPTFPDPHADQGRHEMRFRIRPEATLTDAAEEGHRLDRAERVVLGGQEVRPLVACSTDGIRVLTVKLAEDGSGDLIVRLHEATGGRQDGRLTFGIPFATIDEVDLLERPLDAALHRADTDAVDLTLRAFQILTLRCRPARTTDPGPRRPTERQI